MLAGPEVAAVILCRARRAYGATPEGSSGEYLQYRLIGKDDAKSERQGSAIAGGSMRSLLFCYSLSVGADSSQSQSLVLGNGSLLVSRVSGKSLAVVFMSSQFSLWPQTNSFERYLGGARCCNMASESPQKGEEFIACA